MNFLRLLKKLRIQKGKGWFWIGTPLGCPQFILIHLRWDQGFSLSVFKYYNYME